ncbi:MAG: N-glycosylase, partial [Candidatus Omnitrophica bacterium]|nr:N-glycosylase [Candidatus Omnitrophota bacterium]
RHGGLRIIRQEPWECLASFILSSFNNIPRLTGMLDRLAVRFGELAIPPIGTTHDAKGTPGILSVSYRFPKAEMLAEASERTLRRLGLGFRAPYLKGAARAIASGQIDLRRLQGLDDEALRRALLEVPGVGEKVVECVMLFGYERSSAFPVDVWIGRFMRKKYFRGRKVTDRQIREFAREHFGPHCGWAQQFLYCAARA